MKASEIEIGTPVIYWGVIKDNGERFDPELSVIDSDLWEVCGQIVCKLEGKSGGFSIKHLEKITPENIPAAKLMGLNVVTEKDIAEITRGYYTRIANKIYNK